MMSSNCMGELFMRLCHTSLRWDLFLGAGLRQAGCTQRNSNLIELTESLGMSIFAPGRETRSEPPMSSVEIVAQNCRAIQEACVFVFVPDDAGEGVYYELGFADALGKIVVGFSLAGVEELGKVIQGRWALLPPNRRATRLSDFREILLSLQSTCAEMRTNDWQNSHHANARRVL